VRQHQAQIQEHVQQGQPNEQTLPSPLNIAKYKKTVSSIAWVQLALVACYFPFGIAVALRTWQIVLNTFFGLLKLLKLVSKPASLLLEDKRSERSSKGHNQTVFLYIGLSL